MKLSELLKNVPHKILQGSSECEISSVIYDSRQAKPGSLFICVKGYQTDGHLYISQAVDLGASAIVVEEPQQINDKAVVVQVTDTRGTMPAIAAAFYGHPSHKLKLIGVTGTNGKTTVTYMIKAILDLAGYKTGLLGTISNWIGNEPLGTIRATPESVDFQQLLSRMANQKVDVCVMEVSSHSLALQRVDHTLFHTGTFTNLSEDHLDFHPTMDAYFEEKLKLFYMTKNGNLINADDAYGKKMSRKLKADGIECLCYGIEEENDLIASDIQLSIQGVTFKATGLGMNHSIVLGIPGRFTIYNALAAIGTARILNIDPAIIVQALKSMAGVPGRLERVQHIDDFSVIVDYAHTPDALENVLETIQQFANKRVITVFGCGGDRDQKKRPIMGEIAGKMSDLSIVTSDNPRSEEPASILRMIEAGIKRTEGQYTVIENRKEAIRYAIQVAEPGDVVLIAGKGHETTQTIGHVTTHFDDREIAFQIAKEEGRK